jgi:YVTN family beta-propeller protein
MHRFGTIYTSTATGLFAQGAAGVLFAALVIAAPLNLAQAQAPPSLSRYEQRFAVLAGSTVTNTGNTVVTGDVAVSPGISITGFPTGKIRKGTIHNADAAAQKAQSQAATAYAALAAQPCSTSYAAPNDIGGLTLTPGVYCFSSSAALTGTLTLDGGGNPNSVWVFEIGSTLTTASGSSVMLTNGAQARNVFWQVGSSATLGTNSTMQGNVLALASITLTTNVTLVGRALALNGAVTLDSDTVSACACILPHTPVTSAVANTISVAPPVGGVAGTVFGAALSPDGKSIWVAGSNGVNNPGFVSLVDVASQTVSGSFTVGAGPADIAFSTNGERAFVTNNSAASLSVVGVPALDMQQTLDLTGASMSSPLGVAYADASGQVIVTSEGSGNFITALKASSPVAVNKDISVTGQSGRPAVVPATGPYYPNKVLIPVFVTDDVYNAGHPALVIMNPANGTARKKLTLWSSRSIPQAVVVSPDGKYAYISLFNPKGGPESGGVWVVSLETLTTKTVIVTCDPANYGEAISGDGKYLLVAGFLEDQVALIDTATDTLDAIIMVGHQPNAIVLASDDSEAFITNQSDGTVTVVSFTASL